MNTYEISGKVQKFLGDKGWYYIPLSEELSSDLREVVKAEWPALLAADLTVYKTSWRSSIMPIKDGPLFIALPAKIRKIEDISVGDKITIECVIDY